MRREWTSNWNEMGFNEEELAMVEKVFNCDPASTLYFDGDKNYLWETECGDDYFTKELLIENLALTLNEWEKEGMFDEEDEEESEAPAEEVEEVSVTYQTTAGGCKTFIKDMWSDIGEALDRDCEGLPIPTLIVGNRQIQLVDCPLVYEGIQTLIEDMVAEYID